MHLLLQCGFPSLILFLLLLSLFSLRSLLMRLDSFPLSFSLTLSLLLELLLSLLLLLLLSLIVLLVVPSCLPFWLFDRLALFGVVLRFGFTHTPCLIPKFPSRDRTSV